MKKLFIAFSLLSISILSAQQLDNPLTSEQIDSTKLEYQVKKNIIKLSLTSLAFKNIHVQYERVLSKKISVSLSVSRIFEGGIPMLSSVESYLDDPGSFDQIRDMTLSYYSITPEVRFYLSKKGHGKGFYLAPFYRNSKITLDGVSFDYENDTSTTSTIKTSGSISGNTVGLLLGSQFNLGKSVVLDWWIVGPHYGSGNGELIGKDSSGLSADEQDELRVEITNLELPLVDESSEVNAQGVKVNLTGPWGGVRAGISLGFRF